MKFRLLLPKGSLNTPGRGDTGGMLKQAGYDVAGYAPGRESSKRMAIRNDPEIRVILARPQSMPNELLLGFADMAICGTDWVMEETNGDGIDLIADLDYGKTRIVFALPREQGHAGLEEFIEEKKEIVCFAEYVNTAARAIASTKAYQKLYGDRQPMKIFRGNGIGDNPAVKVIMSDGVTEGYIAKGADIVLDNTQTGSTLREYGLRELEQVATSSACLYASREAMQDPGKKAKAEEISTQLAGVIMAQANDYVSFNTANGKLDAVMSYVQDQRLFSEEATVVRGDKFTQVNVLVPKSRWPEINRELRQRGATAIIRTSPSQIIAPQEGEGK